MSRTVTSGAGSLTILHPTSFTIARGRAVAITGPSGSGKSTLLGLMAGLDAPTTGTILLDGTDITTLGEEALARLRGEKIGIVFQFFHLLPSLTAHENVLVPMEIAGAADAAAARAALLADVGLVGSRPSLSVAAVGRRAAAGRDRARARERSADRAGRRADRQSRQRDRPSGHRSAGVGQSRARPDARARHARRGAGRAGRRGDRASRRPRRRSARGSSARGRRADELRRCAWRGARRARPGRGCCSSSSASRSASRPSSCCAASCRTCARR